MAKSTKKKPVGEHSHNYQITSTVARTDDGGVQITFSVPQEAISHEEEHALVEMAREVTLPGFRKGKAPVDKVKSSVSAEKLLEKTLMRILPHALAHAISDHKLRPAMYPKFEIISQNDPWQIRAVTCEIPSFELGDYKQVSSGALAASSLWTPDKGDPKQRELTKEEKEQKVITALLESIKIDIPKMLVEEEVSARLAQLLSRIEKLGLNLESYLGSIGKTPESLREEYEAQTKQAIALELILNKLADVEKVIVSEKEIDEAMNAQNVDPGAAALAADPEHRRFVSSVLRRRAVLDRLLAS